MPAKNLIGDENGISQIVTHGYIGDENNIAQKVVKVYIGDENNIAQLCYAGAGVKVQIFDASELCYCVIDGVTYNSGTTTDLELEIGTPIAIYMPKRSGILGDTAIVSMRTLDNGVECRVFQHVASKDATITFFEESSALKTTRTAVISGANLSCFLMEASITNGDVADMGFSFRTGMTWREFVESLHNNGYFSIAETGRVYFVPTNTAIQDPSNGNGYVSANDTIVHARTYK